MDRRLVPWVLIAALLIAATAWIWPRVAAGYHGRVIFELAMRYRDRQGPAWPKEDARRLWGSIAWFLEGRPDGLRARILEALEDPDPGRREAALVLTSELELHQHRIYGPTDFPDSGGNPAAHELREFKSSTLVRRHPNAFAAAVRETSERAQFIFLHLARVDDSGSLRRGVEDIITGAGSDTLRLWAIRSLLATEAAPSSLDVLRSLRRDPNPRLRQGALGALACYSDPEGTREFVATISQPPASLSVDALAVPVAWLGLVFPSLQESAGPTGYYFESNWAPGAGLPCDLRAPWEAWLALRESEGFAAAPQQARDQEAAELEDLELPLDSGFPY